MTSTFDRSTLRESDGTELLGLTSQVNNVLRAAGILTIQDLLNQTEQQLLKTPGLGRRSVKQIRDRLKDSGFEMHSEFIRKGALMKWPQ